MWLLGHGLAIVVACVAALVGVTGLDPALGGVIGGLQWFVIAAATLAVVKCSSCWSRNAMMLRAHGSRTEFAASIAEQSGQRWTLEARDQRCLANHR